MRTPSTVFRVCLFLAQWAFFALAFFFMLACAGEEYPDIQRDFSNRALWAMTLSIALYAVRRIGLHL